MPGGPNASLTHGPDCVAAGWANANLQKLLGVDLLTLDQNVITIGISFDHHVHHQWQLHR